MTGVQGTFTPFSILLGCQGDKATNYLYNFLHSTWVTKGTKGTGVQGSFTPFSNLLESQGLQRAQGYKIPLDLSLFYLGDN